MPLPALTTTVEESKALRLQRHQARYRDRGGMYVPPTDNPLMDILMARKATGESPVKRRRSSARPRQSAAAAVAAARRKSKAKAEDDGEEGNNGDATSPQKRKSAATPKKAAVTPKKKAAAKSKGKAKSKAKDDNALPAKKSRKPAASRSKKAKAPIIEAATDTSDDEPLVIPPVPSVRSKPTPRAPKRECDATLQLPTTKPSSRPTTSNPSLLPKDKPIPKPKPFARKPSASKVTRPVVASTRDGSEWESEPEAEPQPKKRASSAKSASKDKPPSKNKAAPKEKPASKGKPASSSKNQTPSSNPPSTSKLLEASPSHVPPPPLSVIAEEEESPSVEIPLAHKVTATKRKFADDAVGKGKGVGPVKKSRKDALDGDAEAEEPPMRVKAKKRAAVTQDIEDAEPPRATKQKKRGIAIDEEREDPPPARTTKRKAVDVGSDSRQRNKHLIPSVDDEVPPPPRSKTKTKRHEDAVTSDAEGEPRKPVKSRKRVPVDDTTVASGLADKRTTNANVDEDDAGPLRPKKRPIANSDTEDEAPKKAKKPRSKADPDVAKVKTKPSSRVGKENLVAREAPTIPDIRPIPSPVKKPASKVVKPQSKATKPPSKTTKPPSKIKPPSYRVPAATGAKRKPPPEVLRRAAAPAPAMLDDDPDEIDFLS